MPRIGGGGGPFVPPQAGGAGQTNQTQNTGKTEFANKVQQAATQGTDAARTAQAKATQQSQLTGKARDIAKRLQAGQLTQKEATREFVGLVIEERFPQLKKKKKRKKEDGKDDEGEPETQEEMIEEAVTELIDRDPELAKRLQTQFKKLAAK
jgi:hypothetical protein